MPRIRYLLVTAVLLALASWAAHGYHSGVLHAEFLAYGQSIAFAFDGDAVITGTVTDASGAPLPDVELRASIEVYRQGRVELEPRPPAVRTNDRGEYRLNLSPGRYYLQAGKSGVAGPGVRMFVPTFYPGASRLEEAQAITLTAREVKSAVNFRLSAATKHSVSGRVLFLATGQPMANVAIRIDPNFRGFGMGAKTQSRGDGTFHLEGLTEGGYRIEVPLPGDSDGHLLKFFKVSELDITNLILRVGDGTTLKGTLRAAGGRLPERMVVQAHVRNPLGGTGYPAHNGTVAANGTFAIRGVEPGICDLAISNAPASTEQAREFFVEAVTVDGQDVSDSGIRVPEGTAPVTVAVTVDFRPGTITGKTLDFDGKPFPGANIALMSADPEKRLLHPYWRENKSDSKGAFRLASLAPGDYLLIIWPGYRSLDPKAFAILERHAVPVRVEQSGLVSVNLRFTKEMRDMLRPLFPAEP